jgi:acetyl-CoA C-acetyltransferase
MAAASAEAMRVAGVGIDDVSHLDLYSCFASSVNFARDALGLDEQESRPLTVTGGLPYHGGAGSDYMTHSIATMADVLRHDPGSIGMLSGVGMHMTKHVYGVYSTEPGAVAPPERAAVQAELDAGPRTTIRDTYAGPATVAAYSVVHGRDGEPEWGLVVCDLPDGHRAYAKVLDADVLRGAEKTEFVGTQVTLAPGGADQANVARPV